MRQTLFAVALSVVVGASFAAPVNAQDTLRTRGTIVSVAANSVTVQVGGQEMKFSVDSNTTVQAQGAGTKTRQAQASGKGGAQLTEVLRAGQPVEVSYQDAGGTRRASRIVAISKSQLDTDPVGTTANGTVKAISGNSLTITGNSGGGSQFTQTYALDSNTKVIAKGASTALAANAGKPLLFSELVHVGDDVRVKFDKAATPVRASEVQVLVKASAK